MVVRYRTNIFRLQEFKLFCLIIIVSTFLSSFIYIYRRHPRNIHISEYQHCNNLEIVIPWVVRLYVEISEWIILRTGGQT